MKRPTQQVNFRADTELRNNFRSAVKTRGDNERELFERFMETYVQLHSNRRTMHLDGSECPLSELFRSVAEKIREMS